MSVAQAPRLVGTATRLRGRALETASTGLYVVVGLPLALAELLVVLPAAIARPRALRRVAALERRLANGLLHARIRPLAEARPGDSVRPVLKLVAARAPAATAAAVAVGALVALLGWILLLALEGLGGAGERALGPWPLDERAGVVLLLLACAAAVVTVAAVDALASPLRDLARRFLLPAAAEAGEVRQALAESVGDATLSIVYWLPDRGAYVDERGLPVELPDGDPTRSYTVVEHEGRHVAAVVHDAELDARPELIRAAAAGAVLALDNERLKAALRARVEELRASRARIVEASIDARRLLERDLHDGAQQHLVALSLDLQLIRGRIEDETVAGLVDGAIETLGTALAELRELARGIHPAALTQQGLGPAIGVLVGRVPVDVEVDVELDERLAPAIEAAAYFVVAEALTNVAKYARATRASVRVRRGPETLTVEVDDDGVGGADPAAGSGIRGLVDRVEALGGRLSVTSEPGRGTTVRAELPVP